MSRRLVLLARDRGAATAVEFALIAPVLCFLILGGAMLALALYQYGQLTEAVRTGARQLATSLNDSAAYSDAISAIQGAAPTLSTSNLTITLTVNGTSCTSSSCTLSAGTAASVSATYPCNVVVMGYTLIPNCQLSSKATEMIE